MLQAIHAKDLPKIKFMSQPDTFSCRITGEVYQQLGPFQWEKRDWNNDGDVYDQKIAGFQKITNVNPHAFNYFYLSEQDFNDLRQAQCIEYVKEHVKVVDKQELDGRDVMYTVSVGPDFVVDVKVRPETGLIYMMQNADGSTVHAEANSELTFPDFIYDEEAVVRLVKNDRCRSSLDEVLASAEERKASQNIASLNNEQKRGRTHRANNPEQ